MTFKRSGISKMDNLDLLIGEDVTNMFILKMFFITIYLI